MRESTAIHEAGHSVCAYLLGKRLKRVTVIETDEYLGLSVHDPRFPEGFNEFADGFEGEMKKLVLIHLAGAAAEVIAFGDYDSDGPESDFHKAVDCATYCVGGPDALQKFIDRSFDEVKELLQQHWQAVQTLAEHLLKHGELTGEQAEEIIRSALPTP